MLLASTERTDPSSEWFRGFLIFVLLVEIIKSVRLHFGTMDDALERC